MPMIDRKEKKKRRRRSGLLDVVNGLLMLLVLGILVVGATFFYGLSQFYAQGPVEEETPFLVERGSSLSLVAARLETQGLISNRLIFQGGGLAMRKQGDLKPGEFRIPAGASMADIMELMTEGRAVEYFITVPEGATSWQVAQRLNDPSQNLTGDPVPVPPEGSILPGRYDYFPRDSRQSVLEEMQARMRAAVDEVWEQRASDLPLESKEELVILASIIEKETGIATERPEVAGLFVNRLRAGMRLQTDPTIIYGITRGERHLDGGITASQKAEATPYNTYVIDGLPPTPIANPGIESLRAAANPADTKHLYMMAVTPGRPRDGHYFASTLAEHQQNEAKYRQQERAAAQQARQPEADAALEPPADADAPAAQ
jgi:UPF0755 protein